jgi:phosphoglucosamine mutase
MSNLGLERYFESLGIPFERTQVGDRYVNERMRECGYNIGGEQSGHVICSDYATTGDGLIAALQVLAVLKKKKRPASEVFHLFNTVPQVHRRFSDPRKKLLGHPRVADMLKKSEKKLGKNGRLVVRYSGTEPIIRIMAEGDDPVRIEGVASAILDVLEAVSHG